MWLVLLALLVTHALVRMMVLRLWMMVPVQVAVALLIWALILILL